MTLVRDPVLQKGFYWYDATAKHAPGFHGWLTAMSPLGVKVRKSVSAADTDLLGNVINPHTFVVFEVTTMPVPWLDAKEFGFPNTATSDTDITVSSSGAEPQKDPLDKLSDSISGFQVPPILIIGGVIAVLGYVFRKDIFESGRKQLRNYRGSGNRRSKSA